MGSDSQDIQQRIGCGSDINLSQFTLNINTTTGTTFSVSVDSHTSVENLKKLLAKKLKVAKDRICLLHREKELHDGTSIKENGIMDGSKIILLPNVETGLLAQRPENTVMQALESLNDSQVNDFLSGKTPLNLSMRLGDHMMLIQLQLSTVNPANSSASAAGSSGSAGSSRTRSIFRSKTSSSARPQSSTNSAPIRFTNANHMYKSLSDQLPDKYRNRHEDGSPQASTSRASEVLESKNEFEELRTIVNSLAKEKGNKSTDSDVEMDSMNDDTLLEQSPIKSLSNLVSGPIKTSSLKNIPMISTPTTTKHTSCPCKSIESSSSAAGCDINCSRRNQSPHKKYAEVKSVTRSSALLHKTLNNPISKSRSAGFQSVQLITDDALQLARSKSSDSISHAEQGIAKMVTAKSLHNELTVDQPINIIDTTAGGALETLNTPDTLAEASRNLTKTLRKLSKEVFSSKSEAIPITEEKRPRTTNTSTNASSSGSHQSTSSATASASSSSSSSSVVAGLGSGAVIESMRNHGRGIYSGTFSGTLNPALQDRYGRPKRDISTVIHILNDLLSATPHYSRGARISFEPAHSSRKYSSSSKRSSISGSSSSAQSHHARSQCSKCTLSSKSGCSADCIRSSGTHRNRHIYVTNEGGASKSTSLPTTPVSVSTYIDCRQCQMPMSSSAPVTPTASPNQSIQEPIDSSLDSSTSSAFDFHGSSGDLSMSSPVSAGQRASLHPICTKCSNMEIENNKTKTKLDQLRLVMQQRREKREARKMRSAPYGCRIIGASATATSTTSSVSADATNATVIQTVEAPPTNPIVEQVNTLA